MTNLIIFILNHPLQSWGLLYIMSLRHYVNHPRPSWDVEPCLVFLFLGLLGGVLIISLATAVSRVSSVFHGIQCIQCIHGKLYSRCKPCVSWCFMLQSSISGTMQIPNLPPEVLSLPSRQYQGTASDPFSWQARRLVPIISKNKISIIKETITIIKETITKNNKDSIRQYSHIFKASNIYSNIGFLKIVLKQKGWDANQQSCESAQHFCFSLYNYLFIRIFWRWQPMFLWVASNFHGSFPSLQVSVPWKKMLKHVKTCQNVLRLKIPNPARRKIRLTISPVT